MAFNLIQWAKDTTYLADANSWRSRHDRSRFCEHLAKEVEKLLKLAPDTPIDLDTVEMVAAKIDQDDPMGDWDTAQVILRALGDLGVMKVQPGVGEKSARKQRESDEKSANPEPIVVPPKREKAPAGPVAKPNPIARAKSQAKKKDGPKGS